MDIILILTCIINSTYTTTWDIKMDWGLGQPNSQHLFLRDELVFKRGFYYIACIIDIILRFAWIMNFIQIRRLNGAILGFILAVFEGYRRIQWNVFRLENEVTYLYIHIELFMTKKKKKRIQSTLVLFWFFSFLRILCSRSINPFFFILALE